MPSTYENTSDASESAETASQSSDSGMDEEVVFEGSDGPAPPPQANYEARELEEEEEEEEEEEDGMNDGDEDSGSTANDNPNELSMKQKKQHDEANFKSWVENIEVETEAPNLAEMDEDQMSTKLMVSSKDFIINDPREYQLELFEIAKIRNTIAVLDTGSGKTLIACLLLRHTVDEELQARLSGKQKRVSFFLVDSVTLVFQQAGALECNLDARIGRYCGAMGTDMWSKEQWDEILGREQIIVMTADILHNCLTHGLVKMKNINLICFDEAHHAKKNHVYARIIRDFYLDEPQDSRPRIFGMTASPVDSRDDPTEAALELEKLLHSRISTASDLNLLRSSVKRPDEQILAYPRLGVPFQTLLYEKLYSRYNNIKCFKRILLFCYECTSQLGAWCADEIWKVALSETEAQKIEIKNERLLSRKDNKTGAQIDRIEHEIQMIREAREIVASHDFKSPELSIPDISGKVLKLQQFLDAVYSQNTEEKSIIFVTQRYTAHCLAALLKHTAPAFLKLGILIGARHGRPGEENVTMRQQMVTVSKFKKGRLNCLIATSVAEEGLDIPDCSKIVRFDLYSTMIQYIQSRGRARHSSSKYVQMVEFNNIEHARRILEVRDAESVMRNFCQKLPDDRLIKGLEITSEGSLAGTFYIEPSTGAKLTPSAALQLLWRFANSLPQDPDCPVPPTYYIRLTADNAFICEIVLPPTSPVLSAEGKPCRTKAEAKQSAAFAACLQLRKKGFLNDYLLPHKHSRNIPANANAKAGLDSKTNTYPMRQKPSFWDVAGKPLPENLYLTVFGLISPEAMGRPYQPLSIITREPLPAIPMFPVYADKGGESEAYAITLNASLPLTPEFLQKLNMFTDRFFQDAFGKVFEITPDIPYWILPVRNVPISRDSEPEHILDYDLIDLVMERTELSWDENTPVEFFENRFFLHRLAPSRRFFTKHAVPDLTPKSDIPFGACTAPKSATIYDYSYFEKQRGLDYPRPEFHRQQPVLSASRVLHRLNYLDPSTERELKNALQAYIIPSAFKVSCLPPGFVSMSIIFPAMYSRLDGYLHARDVCQLMGINVSLDIALEAITKDSDHSGNDNATTKAKKGMGSNYERLEFLGDTFLKLTTTLSLFVLYDEDDEYQLHVKRMMMVRNLNLYQNALAVKLPEYIQTNGFSRREWYPRLKLVKGKKSKKQKEAEQQERERKKKENVAEQDASVEVDTKPNKAEQGAAGPPTAPSKTVTDVVQVVATSKTTTISDPAVSTHKLAPKTIADVCEALIGAAVQDKGFDEGIKVINTVVNNDDHDKTKFISWDSYFGHYTIPQYQSAAPAARHLELVEQIEQKIGYRFKYPRLLASAFIHPSIPFSWEGIPNYQRLEFLGDALHDQVCVRYIFDKYVDKGPQWLTEHKMAMVSNKFLASLAIKLEFHRHLRKNGTAMIHQIQSFAGEVMQAELEAEGANDFWKTVTGSIPKALGDCVEAFIAAMFVDAGFDFSVVEMFFDKFIKPYFTDMMIYDDYAGSHPVTFWNTKLKEVGCEHSRIVQTAERTEQDITYIISAVMVHGAVFTHGKASTLKHARMKAAQNALDKIADMGLTKFLKICDCANARENFRALKARQKEAEKAARLAKLPPSGFSKVDTTTAGIGPVEAKLEFERREIEEQVYGKLAMEMEI